MATQSDWWWNFRPTGYNALAWSGSEGNAAQRFLLCSVVLKPTHTQLSPGKFLYYLWEIISESITDADEEASFRYGSDTDRMVGMSNPAVWIIHSDQPHSPTWYISSTSPLKKFPQSTTISIFQNFVSEHRRSNISNVQSIKSNYFGPLDFTRTFSILSKK